MMSPSRPLIGFDCAQPITQALLPKLVASGAGWSARYFTPDLDEDKDLTAAEITRVTGAIPGFQFVSVFETSAARALGGDSAGIDDAWDALRCASILGQPSASAIYFAVDFDSVPSQVQGPITDYFGAIKPLLTKQGFRVGVYGNGLVCQTLLDSKLVDLAWLAGGMGMTGSRPFLLSKRWALLQHVGDEAGLGLGISIDSDEAVQPDPASYGGWSLLQAQLAMLAPVESVVARVQVMQPS